MPTDLWAAAAPATVLIVAAFFAIRLSLSRIPDPKFVFLNRLLKRLEADPQLRRKHAA